MDLKKLSIAFVVIIIAVIFGMLFIRESIVETDVTAETTNVGLVLTGKKDDANYCQTNYEALKNISGDLNLNIICREAIPEDETCLLAMKELIQIYECKVIIGASFGYGEYIEELAGQYPDVCFVHPMGTESRSNMASCLGRMYQARYLAGIVAGMRTETGEIGYVAAFPIPQVIRQINAFTLGVRSVAPDANVHVSYCDSWVDDAAGDACDRLFQKYPDIDVITMHTNSLMPDRIAAKKGIWSVGFNRDNAEFFPDSYLTACTWKWDDYYSEVILSYLQGRLSGKNEWISIEEGMVSLFDLTPNCAPGTKEAVDEAMGLFESKGFDVFYGPITDNTGVLRVPEGESMSDDEMLNRFDWYVEGVTVEK